MDACAGFHVVNAALGEIVCEPASIRGKQDFATIVLVRVVRPVWVGVLVDTARRNVPFRDPTCVHDADRFAVRRKDDLARVVPSVVIEAMH